VPDIQIKFSAYLARARAGGAPFRKRGWDHNGCIPFATPSNIRKIASSNAPFCG
jgi:hypothetical protein